MASPDEVGVREAARVLGVHENTIRNWAAKGLLTPSRVLPGSGYVRFNREAVQKMRDEMWSQFAPDTLMPEQRDDTPTARHEEGTR